jgi:hypothetical protein
LITARYFSSCPSDSTSRWTPCPPGTAGDGFRSALVCFQLSLSCPFRPLHTFHPPGQRGITPAFGYSAPHPSAGGTLTLLSKRAAQRTLWPPPIPCPASLLRFRVLPLYASLPVGVASAGPNRVSPVVLMRCLCVPPSCTPSRWVGLILACFPSMSGFASKGQARPGKRSS